MMLFDMPSLKNSVLLVEATNFKEDYVDQSKSTIGAAAGALVTALFMAPRRKKEQTA